MKHMNIVVVGHVDHGKSTIIGRLLADTGSLPEGKIEQVKEYCKNNSKPFEYAFLLDALKDEQSQGITIDSARCFFRSKKRDYNIIDAPGHIEFLKNMISGAARAEAGLLVIDADEGVQENSKRHGYLLSMLGINQIVVCINKMDLVDYDENVFNKIKDEYASFLKKINVVPREFIPVSGFQGDNIASVSSNLSWFKGNTVLSALDLFEKQIPSDQKQFRMPVQEVYKFTLNDDRRIVAGRVESGMIKKGDRVLFLPSNKSSEIKSIEGFNVEKKDSVSVGFSTGFTLTEQIFINRGEVMCKVDEKLPYVSTVLKVNLFWMGRQPLVMDKEYFLKLGTVKVPVKLREVKSILDASNLKNSKKNSIDRHEVAECVLECLSSVAFDLFNEVEATGRFVIVDDYDVAGGGIITEFIEDSQADVREQVFLRDMKWDRSDITLGERGQIYGQVPKILLLTGATGVDKKGIARQLEAALFGLGRKVYFLGIRSILRGLDADIDKSEREEHIRRLGEVAHILMDAGLIVIATASDLNNDELKLLQTISHRNNIMVLTVGDSLIDEGLVDYSLDVKEGVKKNVAKIIDMLRFKEVILGK